MTLSALLFKKILPTAIIALFFFVSTPLFARAFVVVEGPGLLLSAVTANAASAAVSAESDASLTIKEVILDGLVPALRQAIITTITQNIVAWINNGFEGGPGYVTDLNGFLLQVADNTALDFLQGTELGFLCSPFSIEVRLSLILDYLRSSSIRDRFSCTLSNNLAADFLNGDFERGGGWASLFRFSTDFQNNPYAAYFAAREELAIKIRSRSGEETTLLGFGGGVFSKGKCVNPTGNPRPGSNTDVNTKSGCLALGGSWQIVTPGSVINENLSQSLGSGFRQLELADEINEIIGALAAQLIQQAITSIDGLSGLSARTSSSAISGRSYLESIVAESTVTAFDAQKQDLVQRINTSIDTERRYQGILGAIASGYQSAQTEVNTTNACAGAKALSVISERSSAASLEIQTALDELTERSAASETSIQALIAIANTANAARTAAELEAAAAEYDELISSGTLKDASALTALLNENTTVHQVTIGQILTQTSSDLSICEG